jgi:hypothetical protein
MGSARSSLSALLLLPLLASPALLAQETAGDAASEKLEEDAPDEGEAKPKEDAKPEDETKPEEEAAADDKLEEEEPPADAEPEQKSLTPPPAEPKVGDLVGGWKLIAIPGKKALPDGRATDGACGYVRDVIAEKGPRVEKVQMQVPCVPTPAGLAPGLPRLIFEDPPPEPPAEPTPAAEEPKADEPKTGAPPAEDPGSPEPKAEEPKTDEDPGAQTGTERRAEGDARERDEDKKEEEDDEPKKPFLKGELTRFGDVQLLNRRTSFGVGIGYAFLSDVHYAVLRPDINLHIGPFSLGLGAPLRFEIFDQQAFASTLAPDPASIPLAFEAGSANLGRFRLEDWDQVEDFLRPLRYLSWGKKEDRLYVDINRIHALTVGHGQLMRRYSPTVDIDEDNLFATVDGYLDFGGFELVAGPFPVPRVFGGLLFVKPLGLFLDDYISRSLSVGFTYLTDLNAPTQILSEVNAAGRTQLPVDNAGNLLYEGSGSIVGNPVHGFGVDGEIKLVKWEFIDLKTYVDWSQLVLPGVPEDNIEPFTDLGFTGGALLRMSFGSQPVKPLDEEEEEAKQGDKPREMKAIHALRLRLEGRTFGPRYLPSFFNTLYESDKLQFGFGNLPQNQRAQLPTKIAWLASQDGQPWRAGFYLEASYQWVDWLGFTAMYEDAIDFGGNAVPAARNLALHAETGQALGFLQLFATYHYRNFEDFTKMFQFGTDNEIFYFGGRMALLPILYLNLGVQRAFRTGFTEDDLPDQKRELAGGSAEEYRFTGIGMRNDWALNFDVEIGWQF